MTIRVSRQTTEALIEETPNLRVSREHIEALTEETPNLRVSREHIEVLYPLIEKTGVGTSTLSMDSVATAIAYHYRSAENTLTLSQDSHITEVSVSASSTLSMSQGVGLVRSFSIFVGNTLELDDSVEHHGPIVASAGSIITLSQLARIPLVIPVSASSAITLSQAVNAAGTIYVSASNTIEFQHFADDIIKLRHVTSTLSLNQSVVEVKATPASSHIELSQVAHVDSVSKTASSHIEITQLARAEPFAQFAVSTIELSQNARSQFQYGSALSTLELGQSVNVSKPIRVSAESAISTTEEVWDYDIAGYVTVDTGLRHSVEYVGGGDRSRSQRSIIGVKQSVSVFKVLATAIPGVATNAISLSQDVWASITLGPEAESTIVLAQASTGDIGYSSDDSVLNLDQTVTYSVVRATRESSSELEVNQSATYVLETGSSRWQYSPFIGESTDPNAPDPPSAAIDGPMVGIVVPFQLVYPSIGDVTDSVALKTPNLGNKDRLAFNRVLRETRGGTLVVFADPIWPKVQTLVLTFSGLLSVEVRELQTFLSDHLGQEIGLIDWEHRYWKGVIVSPSEPIIEDNFDSFTASFDFEGELDPFWNPQSVPMNLRYSPTRSDQCGGYYVPTDPILPDMTTPHYTAVTDNLTKIGNPLYITAIGHVNLARANAAGTTQVVGLAKSDYTVGQACDYYTEGSIERTDWTIIAGTTDLSIGATYFLDPGMAGYITTTAPTTAGQYVVRVGRAVNARILDIEIELPILL